jgi:hypothetical protein
MWKQVKRAAVRTCEVVGDLMADGRVKLATVGTSLTVGAGAAMAALPTAVTTAIDDAQANGTSVAEKLLIMGVVIWGGMFLYRKFFK